MLTLNRKMRNLERARSPYADADKLHRTLQVIIAINEIDTRDELFEVLMLNDYGYNRYGKKDEGLVPYGDRFKRIIDIVFIQGLPRSLLIPEFAVSDSRIGQMLITLHRLVAANVRMRVGLYTNIKSDVARFMDGDMQYDDLIKVIKREVYAVPTEDAISKSVYSRKTFMGINKTDALDLIPVLKQMQFVGVQVTT